MKMACWSCPGSSSISLTSKSLRRHGDDEVAKVPVPGASGSVSMGPYRKSGPAGCQPGLGRPLMKTLEPVSSQSSPSRTARLW